MFNFNEDGVNFLQLDLTETIMLLVTIGLIVIASVVCVSMFFAKRKFFRLTLSISLWTIFAYAVALIIANIALNWSDFEKMYQLYIFVGMFIAIACFVILMIIRKNKTHSHSATFEVKAIAYASICLSVSFALSYIKLFRMPQGGSVTLGSVMLLGLYSYMFGLRRGVLACLVYGMLQSLQDPWVVHPLQYILDYPLAYTMYGFVALFKGRLKKPRVELILGFAVAIVLRYICHFFSGSIYFGSYGEDYNILNPWAWGAIYNLTVPIDGIIACALAVAVMSSKQIRNLIINQGGISMDNDNISYEISDDDSNNLVDKNSENTKENNETIQQEAK